MKNALLTTAIALVLFISCNQQPDTQTIKIKGKYTIDIPTSFTRNDSLNEDASLTYQDLDRIAFVAVIDESKQEYNDMVKNDEALAKYAPNLNGYANLLLDSLKEKIKLDTLPKFKEIKINKLKARILEVTGTISDSPIYWKIAYIEGKNTYYQVMGWTLLSKKEENQEVIDAMINSFRETDKSKRK